MSLDVPEGTRVQVQKVSSSPRRSLEEDDPDRPCVRGDDQEEILWRGPVKDRRSHPEPSGQKGASNLPLSVKE